MTQETAILEQAVRHHRAGELDAAESLYRQVLECNDANGDAHHLLGLVSLARGDEARAVEHLRRAVASTPTSAEFHHHLGVALGKIGDSQAAAASLRDSLRINPQAAAVHNDLAGVLCTIGDTNEAESEYREAIRLAPDLAEAHNNLGNLLHDRHAWSEAVVAFQTAVRLRPGLAELHFNLGNCYMAQEMWQPAADAYRQAIALKPNLQPAHHHQGIALEKLSRAAEAIECQRAALQLDPRHVESHIRLGTALQALDQVFAAEACYRVALALRPQDAQAMLALGTVLEAQRRSDEAIAAYEEAIRRMPDSPDAHYQLASHRHTRGEFQQALIHYDRAVDLAPDRAYAHFYRAATWLIQGDFERGWPESEWRLKTAYAGKPRPQPRWQGEPLSGKRILVFAEWGLGDTLMFVRYLPLVRERGGEVIFEVQPALIPLLRDSGITGLYPLEGTETPECRWQVPLLSLPGVFHTTLETIPASIPYLAANRERVDAWAKRLEAHAGFKIGIQWQGSRGWAVDTRSIPLEEFAAVAIPGVTLFSLQKGADPLELAAATGRFGVVDLGKDLDREGAFLDTAAIISSLDLVISCDTAVAHLAGALGVPVWLATPRIGEWRWLCDRSDSPWYPTMRLFRQHSPREWGGPLQDMAAALARLVGR